MKDEEPEGEVTIVNANSSALKENQMQYSAINCEVLGLKFATDSTAYYLYGASVINIYTDCSALEGIFQKKPRRHQEQEDKGYGGTDDVLQLQIPPYPGQIKHNCGLF